MSKRFNVKLLKWVLVFIACIFVTNYFHSGKKINGVIWSDQEGYYIYLPAVFIHGGFENVPFINGCGIYETENGPRTFTKYTYGVALLESPFFLVAHAVAPLFGYERDGRSLPYIWGIMLAAISYMLIGLWLLSRLLTELQFGKTITWLIPLGILLGTNLFYYTFREAGMSHVYSFFLFSVLLYASHRRSESPSLKWNLLTVVPLALIILIRPTNAIVLLIPMLWDATLSDIPKRTWAFITDLRWWIAFTVALLVLFAPQLAYWKHITGDFVFYSYGDEGFIYWNRPKMLHVLLSPQNGWLVYSPLAALGLVGIGVMLKEKATGWALPAILLTLATYVFGSWWAWWFGGAYGHRCFVDFLPLLAVPAAFAIKRLRTSPEWLQIGLAIFAIVAIFVNIRMSDFYHGMWDGPNWGWADYLEKLMGAFYL